METVAESPLEENTYEVSFIQQQVLLRAFHLEIACAN